MINENNVARNGAAAQRCKKILQQYVASLRRRVKSYTLFVFAVSLCATNIHAQEHAGVANAGILKELSASGGKQSKYQIKSAGNQRYKIGLIDLMLLKRQKLGAITLTKEIGADGVEVDMGGLGNRPTFDNQLLIDSVRKQFLDKAKELDLEIFSLAMTGYYAQSFCNREEYKRSVEDCIATMKLMNVKVAFLPLGVPCDLKKMPAVKDSVVARLKVAGKMAERAGVIIGIETALSAKEEVRLLKQVGSPAVKIYFNFSNPLKEGRDLLSELKILGKDRICMIHATNKDSVWLENDPQIDMLKVKKTLDDMGWSGWLVIERSRDARKPSDVKGNYGANTAYLKKVFQAKD